MSKQAPRQGLDSFIERSERPMLWLAVVAVVIYLIDLTGGWASLGAEPSYNVLTVVIDLIFLCDLLLKATVRRGPYLRSAWFLVDLFSTAPILTHTRLLPSTIQGLRFVRTFRQLRVLRTLRALNVLRSFKAFDFDAGAISELELDARRRLEQVLAAVVVAFVVFFLGVSALAHTTDEDEFWLVLGSVVGMTLMLLVVRFQIPAVAAAQVRGLLNIALPHQVARHFLSNPESYDRTVQGPATIIFCDIVGFTSAVESLGSDTETLKKHLEQALDCLVEAHIAQDLIVDKFIGDAVMSFRGGEHVTGTAEEHAWRVVRGALDGARALRLQNNPIFSGVKIGGASATNALIGTFGTSRRLSYTILGDRVNLAARLEGANSKIGTRNLFCARTHQLTAGRADILWRRVGSVSVSGKDEHVEVFEAFDTDDDTSWVSDYEAAVALFEVADFEGARTVFRQVNALREGGDSPSTCYIDLCDELIRDGAPADWQPVLVTRK